MHIEEHKGGNGRKKRRGGERERETEKKTEREREKCICVDHVDLLFGLKVESRIRFGI